MTVSKPQDPSPAAPDPREVAITTAHLRETHREQASGLQKTVDQLTALMGWPGFVALLSLAMLFWATANCAAWALGFVTIDPPPFMGLQLIASTGAMLVAVLILATQRHEDVLADHRAQLILELSISNDQKIAKIVSLLEETRRDNPALANRVDEEAAAMSSPSDTKAVLEAIKDLRGDAG